jgi:Ca2+-transporting ATPase
MILWVNLVTDGACTVPLGVEPAHGDVLQQPPRDPDESLLDKVALRRMAILTPLMAVGTLVLFWLELEYGGTEQHAVTIAFTTMAAYQWFQALNARSRHGSIFRIGLLGNRWLLVGLAVAVVLQIVAVQTPIGHAIFGTVSLTWWDWLLIVLVSGSILVADELLKLFGLHGRRKAT